MKIVSSKNKLIALLDREKNLGFVPTMGCIHSGHISLIKKSIKQNKKTVVSIFVNKPQFNKKSDFAKYPRVLKNDISKLKKIKVNYLFLPTHKQMYKKGINRNIKVSSFGKILCGKNRPGHFERVVDVVERFINIIKPKHIYFGKKDFQQLKIVEHFLKRNNYKTKLVACNTVRDKYGLALSSRNYLLSAKERVIASKIYRLLVKNKKKLINKRNLVLKIKKVFFSFGVKKLDYIKIININKAIKPYKKKNKYKIFIAYYLGDTRLIDNI